MTPDQAKVLTVAALRAGAALQLSDDELAQVIGVEKHAIEHLKIGQEMIPVNSGAGLRCQMLIRMFRALEHLVGGDQEMCRQWLRGRSEAVGGNPAAVIVNPDGLREVVEYLEAIVER
jgi:hypothetical protein